jgi:hypothetical protein
VIKAISAGTEQFAKKRGGSDEHHFIAFADLLQTVTENQ